MPIRPEYRKFYDARWRRFRLTVIEAAGGKCQACGREHRMLNVAHLAHDPARQGELGVLCPSCHAKHDARQRFAVTRRTWSKRRKQLWLSEEIELAAVPTRLLPLRLRQISLFD